MRIVHFILTMLLALTSATSATSARAEPASSQAEQLFYDGRRLLESHRYAEACDKLERSQRLDPGLGTLALLAYCHEMQGRTATAYAEYERAVRLAEELGDSERRAAIEAQRARLKPRLSTLRVVVTKAPPRLELLRAGRAIDRAEWGVAVPVDPGTLRIDARAPGFESWTANVTVRGGGAQVELSVPALTRTSPDQEQTSSVFDTPVLIALGVGAVGLGAGTYFGLRARSLNEDSNAAGCDADNRCSPEGYELRKDAQRSARVANVAFGIGAAGIATGVVLLLTRGDSDAPAARASLRVVPAPRGAWASLEHSF